VRRRLNQRADAGPSLPFTWINRLKPDRENTDFPAAERPAQCSRLHPHRLAAAPQQLRIGAGNRGCRPRRENRAPARLPPTAARPPITAASSILRLPDRPGCLPVSDPTSALTATKLAAQSPWPPDPPGNTAPRAPPCRQLAAPPGRRCFLEWLLPQQLVSQAKRSRPPAGDDPTGPLSR